MLAEMFCGLLALVNSSCFVPNIASATSLANRSNSMCPFENVSTLLQKKLSTAHPLGPKNSKRSVRQDR
jgi:hypothetical protein